MRFLITHTPKSIKKTYWAPFLLAKARELSFLCKYYHGESKITLSMSRTAIFMVDGRFRHGGLCDRLHGIISSYIYCKDSGIDFKQYFVKF